MSQHDYALADQAGAAFLADLNNVLGAIVSQNSGATEPADTYPYQFWADTTSGWLKQRNAGDTAWEMRVPLACSRDDVASASTIDLDAATAAYLRITGTTTVTAVTLADGQVRHAVAGGAFQITHGASLILPGAANYTCTSGDILHFFGEAAGVVRVAITKSDGTEVAGPPSVKVGYFTRDISLAAGTQDVTGLGFTPRWVMLMGAVPGANIRASWGFSDLTSNTAQYDDTGTSADTYNYTNAHALMMRNTNATEAMASVSGISDGFRLTWTKSGSPTGTARIHYLAGE